MTHCERVQDQLSDLIDGALSPAEAEAVSVHLEACADCRQELAELRSVVALLHAVPPVVPPADLAERVHLALAALPDEPAVPRAAPPRASSRFNWGSAAAGAAVAAFVAVAWNLQPSSLPRIETAAVSVQQDVAVNIGFDVERSVEDVTFQVDLPEGLRFIDDARQPMLAQSVSWKGSLVEGKTVIPVTVRGVRPGRWEIEAYVRKGPMMRKTTILLPVTES